MMGFRRRESRRCAPKAVCFRPVTIVAILLMLWSVPAPHAFAFSSRIHTRITENAFPFMPSGVLTTIVDGNDDEDQGAEADLAERHAQNCRFFDSAQYINMRYRQVVAALKQPQRDDPNRAPRLFGHILHGVQDFYAHSNWIPTQPEGLGIRDRIFQSGLGFWPEPKPYARVFDDILFVEGDAGPGMSVRLSTDASGGVSSAIPVITTASGTRFRGLMTSGAPRKPGDQHCPIVAQQCDVSSAENVCLRHGEKRSAGTSRKTFTGAGSLNLDGEGGGDWFQARHFSRLQSQHEWCRLLHLTRTEDPSFQASGRVLGHWVAKDSGETTPHIVGTACQRGAARRTLIEVTATPSTGAPPDVPFLVFRSDFSSSARTMSGRLRKKTLSICGNPGESVIATLVPERDDGAILVINVPNLASSSNVTDHRGSFSAQFSVKVTPNVC